MSDPVLPPPSDEAPIDAEFEPAPKRKAKPEKKSGPGWFSFLLLGGVSFGALALSVLSSGVMSGTDTKDAMAADIERLKVDAQTASEDRASLRRITGRTDENSTALRAELEALQTDLNTLEETLNALEADLMSDESEPDADAAPAPVIGSQSFNMAPLLARIEGLEAMVAALPADAGIDPNEDTSLTPTETPTTPPVDVTEIETELGALRTDIETLRDEVTTLRTDLTDLMEAQQTAADAEIDAATGASAAVALSAIEAAARRGQPFQMAYQTLVETAPDMRGVKALAPLASTGAPQLSDLRDGFIPLKREALKVDAQSKGSTASVLQSLFGDGLKVRRPGDADTASVLETAQTALVTGDIDAALSAIDTLPQNIQAVFTDWRDDAQNRLTLEDSLDTLRLAMIAKDRP